jgi:hypothetical protein
MAGGSLADLNYWRCAGSTVQLAAAPVLKVEGFGVGSERYSMT